MDFITKELDDYCGIHTEKENDVLAALNRETHLKVIAPRMLSGHLQGRFLSMISKMIQPKNVLEIGTYTGYSALCFAEGLAQNGEIDTIDHNEELKPILDKYLLSSPYKNNINIHFGNALQIIPTLNKRFDLVFIDADKSNYSNYFDLIIDKVNSGGIILADNVLWSGKVLFEKDKMDKDTKAIHEFNQKIQEDNRVENVLLPIRDGIMMVRKK